MVSMMTTPKNIFFQKKKKTFSEKKIMGLLQDKYIFALSPQYELIQAWSFDVDILNHFFL